GRELSHAEPRRDERLAAQRVHPVRDRGVQRRGDRGPRRRSREYGLDPAPSCPEGICGAHRTSPRGRTDTVKPLRESFDPTDPNELRGPALLPKGPPLAFSAAPASAGR